MGGVGKSFSTRLRIFANRVIIISGGRAITNCDAGRHYTHHLLRPIPAHVSSQALMYLSITKQEYLMFANIRKKIFHVMKGIHRADTGGNKLLGQVQ